jgi:DNA-binding NarL/FixJ family response regulator
MNTEYLLVPRVVVVDESPLLRELWALYLQRDGAGEVIGAYASCEDLLANGPLGVDVLVVDQSACGVHLSLLGEVAMRWPAALRVVISGLPDYADCKRAGADWVLDKAQGPGALVAVLVQVREAVLS